MSKAINNDEEPVIIADYKFDAIRIGDYMGSPFEHMQLNGGMCSRNIRKYTIQFMNPFMPILIRKKSDGKWYSGNDIFAFDGKSTSALPGVIKNNELYDDEVYLFKANSFNAQGDAYSLGIIPVSPNLKENYTSFKKIFAAEQQTCTDDTKCAIDIAKAVLKHGDEYKFSDDKKKYTFVSNDSSFANTQTNKNNFEDGYMRELAGNFDADWAYTNGIEFGNSARAELEYMRNVYYKQQNNETFNFSDEIKKYKKNGHQGKSFANGCVMRLGPIIFIAQSFKQGLKLAEIAARTTHDHPLSIKSARAVVTAGMCANYGLRRETIRKIIHFLYYDPDPLKGTGISYDHNWPKDYCTFDFLSHRKENSTPEQIQEADEAKLNTLIENNQFTDRSLPTAFLAINICLTSKCAEEAASRILRACGDCDTIGATAMPIVAALFGLPADWVNRIWAISMSKTISKPMTSLKPNKQNTKDENYQDNPKDIKVFDKQGRFIGHNEVSRISNEEFKHHYREYAPFEAQFKNINELENYLNDQAENSKAENKKQLLKEIFNDIKSDINFMLDKNQEYELEELSQDVKSTLENMQEITEQEVLTDDKKWQQKHKQENAKYKWRINKHRNATAKFQTKMKNQKLDNLTKENIAHINEEIGPINKLFKERGVGEVSVDHLKAKEQVINKPIENNDLAQTQKKLDHANELKSATVVTSMPAPVKKQNNLSDTKNLNVSSEKKHGNVTKESAVSLDNKNVKKPTVVVNKLQIKQSDSKALENESKNQVDESKNQTNKVNKTKQNLIITQIKASSVQDQVQNDKNKRNKPLSPQENLQTKNKIIDLPKKQNDSKNEKKIIKQEQIQNHSDELNELSQKQKENPQISKDAANSKNDPKNDVSDNSGKQKEIPSQNEINHKPFVWSSFVLLVVNVLLFTFKSVLTYFPAAIGTGGLVLLLFVWIYKTCSRRSEQSLVDNVSADPKNMEQPLVKDNLTKAAEIDDSIPKQVPRNDKSKIDF